MITISDVAALSKQVIYNDGDFQIVEASVVDAQASMEAGKLTAVELTQKYLDRIAAYDNATVNGDPATALELHHRHVNPHALADAAALDAERATSGPRSLLHGIPVIVKDNFNTFDMPTTVGCKCLDGFVPGTDAYMVEKLRDAGAIILAKANLTEFASGYTGQSSYKRSSNAYLPGGESGGSSAGTGAAIAANLGMIGLGSDTGGSIQVPGAYQGLADVYQSFGLVSREGIAPLAGDQDRGGPLTRTLADSVIMLDLYAGSDPDDATTVDADADREDSYAAYLDKNGLDGARIGYVSTIGAGQPPRHQPRDQPHLPGSQGDDGRAGRDPGRHRRGQDADHQLRQHPGVRARHRAVPGDLRPRGLRPTRATPRSSRRCSPSSPS